jgi:peptidoglycan/LPS O-acetylase OafA/YrhL
LSVVLYHAKVPFITGGFTGVDIFFVISGYLIGGHIYSDLCAGRFSYLRFYQRRAKRILPAFYCVLIVIMVAALVLLSPSEATSFSKTAFAGTLSASNILFWKTANYFNPTNELNPLLMTWSLGVEEQFYVAIPLMMVILTRLRRDWLLLAISAVCTLSFLFASLELHNQPDFVFYMLPARAWELGVGVVLAVVEINRKRLWLTGLLAQASSLAGMALMLFSVCLITGTTPFPGAAALPSVLGAALVIGSPFSLINRRLLSLPPLVFIGRISYSWYLWYWPLLTFGHILLGDNLPPAITFLAVVASFGAAVLSYYLVEQPFRNSHLEPVPLLLRYGAVSIAVLVACTVIWRTHGIPERFPALAQVEADLNKPEVELNKCTLPDDSGRWNLPLACYGPKNSGPSVAVWGDSHARVMAPGLRSISTAQGYGFILLTRHSCPPLTGASVYDPQRPLDETACSQFNRKALDLLKADQNVRIVILVSFWESPFRQRIYGQGSHRWSLTTESDKSHAIPTADASRKIFTQSLTATIRNLREAGKEVIVIEDAPDFDFDPVSSA